MPTIFVNSKEALSKFIGDVRELWDHHKFLRVSLRTGKDRSSDHNAVSHCWYAQIANELREDTAAGVKRYCKLHHAVPILRAEDDDFRGFYDLAVKHNLSYEQKLKAMDFIPMTSVMSVKQMSQYMDAVQADFLKRGVLLEYKDDDK